MSRQTAQATRPYKTFLDAPPLQKTYTARAITDTTNTVPQGMNTNEQKRREKRDKKDLELINDNYSLLNKEAKDVLDYQVNL